MVKVARCILTTSLPHPGYLIAHSSSTDSTPSCNNTGGGTVELITKVIL